MYKNPDYDSMINQATDKLQLDASALHNEWDPHTCALYDSPHSDSNHNEDCMPFFSSKFYMREHRVAQQRIVIHTVAAPTTKGYQLLNGDPRIGKTFTVKHLLNTLLDNGLKVCVCGTT